MALPTIYEIHDPTSNLAGDPLGYLAALMAQPTTYVSADGTPIGPGNSCMPMTMGMNDGLRGFEGDRLVLPPIIEDNRIEFGERWALPIVVGLSNWAYHRSVARAGAWALGAYMAPFPVALFLGAVTLGGSIIADKRAQGLGYYDHSISRYKIRKEPRRYTKIGRRARRRCAKYATRVGKRVCIKYKGY